MRQALRRIARWTVYGIPFLILSILKVRFVSLTHPERIGHLCIEPDCLIKEGVLGLRPAFRPVLLLPSRNVANHALAEQWHRHLTVVSSPFWCRAFSRLQALPGLSYSMLPYAVAIDDTAKAPAIYAKWGARPPILSLEPREVARGREVLRRLGMPVDAWFVCVHSREGGYSPADEHLHSYRNSDINSYKLAMQAVVERGGWCVRVGEKSAKPLAPMQGVIDYAHSDTKSDWMDVFLCAQCRFFLGNSSGLYLAATVFGRPSALANLTPLSSTLPPGPGDIGIPKLLRNQVTGKLASMRGILESPAANYRFAAQYAKDGLSVEENSPADIRDAAIEAMDRIHGGFQTSSEDEDLQARFHALFKLGHYSYGAASRVGRDFLRKYASLLD